MTSILDFLETDIFQIISMPGLLNQTPQAQQQIETFFKTTTSNAVSDVSNVVGGTAQGLLSNPFTLILIGLGALLLIKK
jgi:hypothetical protein